MMPTRDGGTLGMVVCKNMTLFYAKMHGKCIQTGDALCIGVSASVKL